MKKKIKTNRLKLIFSTLLAFMFLAPHLQALTIKIGSIVPLRSPWIKELRKLDLEWRKITNGKVKIKIYAGGIAGSEEDMVRKIRIGILGGAVFTNRGITHVYPDSYVLTIPFNLNSEAELDYIMAKMTPIFEKEIENKGFKVLLWSKAGWIHFFSKKPVVYPKDLKKHKVSYTTGSPAMEQAWKRVGFHVVPNELKDMMMGLQSGMVNAFYLPPLLAASGQYFAQAPNMCSMPIAPVVGGLVVSKKKWDRIPDQYKEEMLAVAEKMADALYKKTIELEKEAIEEMKKNGLLIHQVPPDAVKEWKGTADKTIEALVGKAFSKEIYDTMVRHLNEYRKSEK